MHSQTTLPVRLIIRRSIILLIAAALLCLLCGCLGDGWEIQQLWYSEPTQAQIECCAQYFSLEFPADCEILWIAASQSPHKSDSWLAIWLGEDILRSRLAPTVSYPPESTPLRSLGSLTQFHYEAVYSLGACARAYRLPGGEGCVLYASNVSGETIQALEVLPASVK